jgi:heme oxygenase
MGTPPLPLLDQLRSLTWHRHESFERLPFVTALMAGTLPLVSYIAQLRGLAIIFSALEQSLAQSRSPQIAHASRFMKSRFDLLCADLAFFSPQLVPDILPAVQHALRFSRNIRALSYSSSGKLLGYLYVLEGTTKGNQVHLPDITRCFNLHDDAGTTFYRGYGGGTEAHWEEFRTTMNCAGEEIAQEAIQGAGEIYDALERFHECLFPVVLEELGFTASALNPEAGDHPVHQNRDVLQAALRAGHRCREEFSYYERRYGERGRRFTDSDAAWLAALADKPSYVVANQVLWLGRMLSNRGMPLLLLERQLDLLVEELGARGNGTPTEALRDIVAELRQQRTGTLSQSRFEEACRTLTSQLHSPGAIDFPDLSFMLVAAFLDTHSGIPECLTSLLSWLGSASVLTEEEIAATKKFLNSLRSDTTAT